MSLLDQLRDLLWHPLGDRCNGAGDYDRLVVVDSGPRGYDVVLRIDGGYSHPRDADDARARWQQALDAALGEIANERVAT
jgi:hypothetical protein